MNYTCASCQKMGCVSRDKENMPLNCPSLKEEMMSGVREQYAEETDAQIAYESARTRIDATRPMTRLEEAIDFARRSGYRNLGVAFCKMVKKDAEAVTKRLREEGFNVHSVMCRTGAISDELLEREGENFIGKKGYETMCNPIGQAAVLKDAGTEFNIVMGLCVGHDTLFIRHSDTPMTILGVKDRKNGCTPIF